MWKPVKTLVKMCGGFSIYSSITVALYKLVACNSSNNAVYPLFVTFIQCFVCPFHVFFCNSFSTHPASKTTPKDSGTSWMLHPTLNILISSLLFYHWGPYERLTLNV